MRSRTTSTIKLAMAGTYESYRLVITDPQRSYYIELINREWRNLAGGLAEVLRINNSLSGHFAALLLGLDRYKIWLF